MTLQEHALRRRQQHLVVLVLLAAFALRVWGLADHSIWWDEGWTATLARKSAGEILRFVSYDNHPPLYNLILRGWWLLVGDGTYVLRFPAVLSSALWVALVYRIGTTLGGKRAGLYAALFLAFSRFAVEWSQQIRMYTWSAMLVAAYWWAALMLWKRRSAWAWSLCVLAGAGALLSLYLTVSAPLAANLVFVALWLLASRPGAQFWRWISSQAAMSALALPWMILNASHVETWTIYEPISLVDYLKLYATMLVVGDPQNIDAHLPLTLLGISAWMLALVGIWRGYRSRHQTAGFVMLLCGLAVQAVVIYAVCFGLVPGFARPLAPRYLLLLSTAFYVLAGWGIAALAPRRRWVSPVLALLLLIPMGQGLVRLYPDRTVRDDYISIAATLDAQRRTEDAVVLYVDRDWPLFDARYAGERRGIPYGMAFEETSVASTMEPIWESSDAVWLVTTPEALQSDPTQLLPAWLRSHAMASQEFIKGEAALTLYVRTTQRADLLNTLAPEFTPPANVMSHFGLAGAAIPLSRYRTGDTLHLALYWQTPTPVSYTVEVSGPSTVTVTNTSPSGAPGASTRQLISIPLTPELAGGNYEIAVTVAGEPEVRVGSFELIQKIAGAVISVSEIPYRVDYRLGESIRLIGYDLPQTTYQAGGIVPLTLYWQTDAPLTARYKVFTHLLGSVFHDTTGNFLWGQQDNEPDGGQSPTTLWASATIIADAYRIPIDPAAPAGSYVLEVGMYGLVDAARLPVTGPAGSITDDAILLTTIEIE